MNTDSPSSGMLSVLMGLLESEDSDESNSSVYSKNKNIKSLFQAFDRNQKPFDSSSIDSKITPLFTEAKSTCDIEDPDFYHLLSKVTISLFEAFKDPSLTIWANSLHDTITQIQTRICTALIFYCLFKTEFTTQFSNNDSNKTLESNQQDCSPSTLESDGSTSIELDFLDCDEITITSILAYIKRKSNESRSVCTTMWTHGVFYRCSTCSTSRSSTICVDCFHAGDHTGHDYHLSFSTAGGTCDCGATNGILQRGFCKHHKGTDSEEDPSLFLPLHIRKSAHIVVSAIISQLAKSVSSIIQRTIHNSNVGSFNDNPSLSSFVSQNSFSKSFPSLFSRFTEKLPRIDIYLSNALYSSKFGGVYPLCMSFYSNNDITLFQGYSKWLSELANLSQSFRRIITNTILDAPPIDPKNFISTAKSIVSKFEAEFVHLDTGSVGVPVPVPANAADTSSVVGKIASDSTTSLSSNEPIHITIQDENVPPPMNPKDTKYPSGPDFSSIAKEILVHGPVAEPRSFLSVFFFEIGPYLPQSSDSVTGLLMTLIFDHKFKASSAPAFLRATSLWGRDIPCLTTAEGSFQSIHTPWLSITQREERLESWITMFRLVAVQYYADPIFVRAAAEYGNAIELLLRLVSVLSHHVCEKPSYVEQRIPRSLESIQQRKHILEQTESLSSQPPPLSALILSYLGLESLSSWVTSRSKQLTEFQANFRKFDFLAVGPYGHSNFSGEPRLSVLGGVISLDHFLIDKIIIRPFLTQFIYFFQVTEFVRKLWKLESIHWANHEIPGPATDRLEKSFQSFVRYATYDKNSKNSILSTPAHIFNYSSVPSVESLEALEFWDPNPNLDVNTTESTESDISTTQQINSNTGYKPLSSSWLDINRMIIATLLPRFHGMDMHKTGAVTWSEVQRRDLVTKAFSFSWTLARISWFICNSLFSEPTFSKTRAVPAHDFTKDLSMGQTLTHTCNSVIEYLYGFLTTKRFPPFRSLSNENVYSTCDLPVLMDSNYRIRYDINTQPITFHIPIHRYLAHFLAALRIYNHFSNLNGSQSQTSTVSIDMDPIVTRTIMEHPLRIFSGLAQLGTTRSGTELRRRLQNYHGNAHSHTTIISDAYLLSECLSKIETSKDTTIDTWSIWSAFLSKYGFEIFQYSFPLDDQLAQESIYKTHRLLKLVIAIGSFDFSSSVFFPNHPLLARKDVIQSVAYSKSKRSVLESSVKRESIKSIDIDSLVKKSSFFIDAPIVCEFHPPDVKTPGYYTLCDKAWDEFDPFYLRCSPVWADISTQNWYRQVWYIMAAGDEKVPIYHFCAYFNSIQANPKFCHPQILSNLSLAPVTSILSSKYFWGVVSTIIVRHKHDRYLQISDEDSDDDGVFIPVTNAHDDQSESDQSPSQDDNDSGSATDHLFKESALSVLWLDLLYGLSSGLVNFQRVAITDNVNGTEFGTGTGAGAGVLPSPVHVSPGFKSEFHSLYRTTEKVARQGMVMKPLLQPFWKSAVPVYKSDPQNTVVTKDGVYKQQSVIQPGCIFQGQNTVDGLKSLNIYPLNSLFEEIPLQGIIRDTIIRHSQTLTSDSVISIFTLLVESLLDSDIALPERISVPTSYDQKETICENQENLGILILERCILENVVAAICIIDNSNEQQKQYHAEEYVTRVLQKHSRVCNIPQSLSDLAHITPFKIFSKKVRNVPSIRISHSGRHSLDSESESGVDNGDGSRFSSRRSPSPRTRHKVFAEAAKSIQEQTLSEISSLSDRFLQQLMAEDDWEEEEDAPGTSLSVESGIDAGSGSGSSVAKVPINVDGYWGASGGLDFLFSLSLGTECQQCKNEITDSIGVISSIETHRILAQSRNFHVEKQVTDHYALSRRRVHNVQVSENQEIDYWTWYNKMKLQSNDNNTDSIDESTSKKIFSVIMDPHASSILGFDPASLEAVQTSYKAKNSQRREDTSSLPHKYPNTVCLFYLNDIDTAILENHAFSNITSTLPVAIGKEREKHISLCGHIDSTTGEPRVHILHHKCHIEYTKHLVNARKQLERNDPQRLNYLQFNAYAGEYSCPTCRSYNSTLVPLPTKQSRLLSIHSLNHPHYIISSGSSDSKNNNTPLEDDTDVTGDTSGITGHNSSVFANSANIPNAPSKDALHVYSFWPILDSFYNTYYSDVFSHQTLSDLSVSASLYGPLSQDSTNLGNLQNPQSLQNTTQSPTSLTEVKESQKTLDGPYWVHLWNWAWITFARLNIPIEVIGSDSDVVNKARITKTTIKRTLELSTRIFPYLFALLYQELRTSEFVQRPRPITPFDTINTPQNQSEALEDQEIPGFTNGLENTRLLLLWSCVYHFFSNFVNMSYRRRWSVLYLTLLHGYTPITHESQKDQIGSIPLLFDQNDPTSSSSSTLSSKSKSSFGGVPCILCYDSIQVFLSLLMSGIPIYNHTQPESGTESTRGWQNISLLSNPSLFTQLAQTCLGISYMQALYSLAYNPLVYSYCLNGDSLSLIARNMLSDEAIELRNPLDFTHWDPDLLFTVKWMVSPNSRILYRILYSGILNFETDADFSSHASIKIPHSVVKTWIYSAKLASPTLDINVLNIHTAGPFKPLVNTNPMNPNVPLTLSAIIVPPLPPLLGIRRDIPDPWINLIKGKIAQDLKYFHFYPSYLTFMEATRNTKCTTCGTQPNRPAICLMCGKYVCMLNTCCSVGSLREMTYHTRDCGAGYALFLDLSQGLILVINGDMAYYPQRTFIDEYGEEDQGLYRGKPLYLHSENFYTLNKIYYGLLFSHESSCTSASFVHARP